MTLALALLTGAAVCVTMVSCDDEDVPAEDRSGVDVNGREYVDLGLPSGTLWAAWNVGASSPEGYGVYFSWGGTVTKSTYNWSTYEWCMGESDMLTKYCNNDYYGYAGYGDALLELELADDAATAAWGPGWRTPSRAQLQELINGSYTTTAWTGYGLKITSKANGNSIFLPAAGFRYDSSLSYAGSDGYYWSRTLDTDDTPSAYDLYFYSGGKRVTFRSRNHGMPVRAVYVE